MKNIDGTPETSIAGPWSVPGENLERIYGIPRRRETEAPTPAKEPDPEPVRALDEQEVQNLEVALEAGTLEAEDIRNLIHTTRRSVETARQMGRELSTARGALKELEGAKGEKVAVEAEFDPFIFGSSRATYPKLNSSVFPPGGILRVDPEPAPEPSRVVRPGAWTYDPERGGYIYADPTSPDEQAKLVKPIRNHVEEALRAIQRGRR